MRQLFTGLNIFPTFSQDPFSCYGMQKFQKGAGGMIEPLGANQDNGFAAFRFTSLGYPIQEGP